jgi:hypothetical protein
MEGDQTVPLRGLLCCAAGLDEDNMLTACYIAKRDTIIPNWHTGMTYFLHDDGESGNDRIKNLRQW